MEQKKSTSTTYIFGFLPEEYSQFPFDETSAETFQRCARHMHAPTQIVVHRFGQLMYYTYIRRFDENGCIGLCALYNKAWVTDLEELFAMFESVIARLIDNDLLIRIDKYGAMQPKAPTFGEMAGEAKAALDILQHHVNNLRYLSYNLPPDSYANSLASAKQYEITSRNPRMLEATYTCGYTCIYKYEHYNTPKLQKLIDGIKERAAVMPTEENLEQLSSPTLRKKKRSGIKPLYYIIAALVVVIAAGVLIYHKTHNSTESLPPDPIETEGSYEWEHDYGVHPKGYSGDSATGKDSAYTIVEAADETDNPYEDPTDSSAANAD